MQICMNGRPPGQSMGFKIPNSCYYIRAIIYNSTIGKTRTVLIVTFRWSYSTKNAKHHVLLFFSHPSEPNM